MNSVFLFMRWSGLLPSKLHDFWYTLEDLCRSQPWRCMIAPCMGDLIEGESSVAKPHYSLWAPRCWWGAWLPLMAMFLKLWLRSRSCLREVLNEIVQLGQPWRRPQWNPNLSWRISEGCVFDLKSQVWVLRERMFFFFGRKTFAWQVIRRRPSHCR